MYRELVVRAYGEEAIKKIDLFNFYVIGGKIWQHRHR